MKFDYIFFDSGGTLFVNHTDPNLSPPPADVGSGSMKRVHALLPTMGVDIELEVLEQMIIRQKDLCGQKWGNAYTFFKLMQAVVAELQPALGAEEAACLADAYAGPRYASWLFPGTQAALRTLSESGYRLGIIANTAWPGFCLDRAFAGVGLLPFLGIRIYSGDIGIAKPDPGIFRFAERSVGLAGKRILYVGNDVDADIKGASAVGWSTAFRRVDPTTTQGLADMEFDHISELVSYCLS